MLIVSFPWCAGADSAAQVDKPLGAWGAQHQGGTRLLAVPQQSGESKMGLNLNAKPR